MLQLIHNKIRAMLLLDGWVVNNQVLMFSNDLIFTANWQFCCHLAVKLLAPLASLPIGFSFRWEGMRLSVPIDIGIDQSDRRCVPKNRLDAA